MKILYDSEVHERCNGCGEYGDHNIGKDSEGHPVFRCVNCGRLTVWMGGDTERVIAEGNPPATV
jgi:uncharacterized Zn finger protein